MKRKLDIAYKNYRVMAEEALSNDRNTFWSYNKSKRASTTVPEVFLNGVNHFSDPEDIVNAFGDFFRSVYARPSKNNVSFDNAVWSEYISIEHIPEQIVMSALKKIKG